MIRPTVSKRTGMIGTAVLFLIMIVMTAGHAHSAEPALYAASDLRVLYLFDDEEKIDWPTLFYLNEQSGCRIDLVTLGSASGFSPQTTRIEESHIHLHRFFPSPSDTGFAGDIIEELFRERRPDILIAGELVNPQVVTLFETISSLSPDSGSIFNLVKVYRLAGSAGDSAGVLGAVTMNVQELWEMNSSRIALEVPQLFSWYHAAIPEGTRLQRYVLVKSLLPAAEIDPNMTHGLPRNRLQKVIDSVLSDGAIKQSFLRRAKNYQSFFDFALKSVGRKRIENIMQGYRELVTLVHQAKSDPSLGSIASVGTYLDALQSRSQAAVLSEIGLSWQGDIILRDSPHGPRLKFRASLAVNGPQEIELSYVNFHPYWDTVTVALDSEPRRIKPHQAFVREYLVEIDRERLEAQMPESLMFSAGIVYGRFPMEVRSAVPIWEAPALRVRFQPDFHFIQPFARLNVDKVVASMNWKAVINKPRHFYGRVRLDLTTPRGVFAGAYRHEIDLDKNHTSEVVRIPFSVSNLFEMGIQRQTIRLMVDDREVAADTGIIQIASCHVEDTIQVGFVSDSTGLLEDILRMTDASFRPLTNRSLLTSDLEAYSVLLVGSGAHREYPALGDVRGRLEDFVRSGGSLVILGQPGDWPEGALPVALNPVREVLRADDILNRIEDANILSRPHKINQTDLLGWIKGSSYQTSAVVSPAERVFVTPSGATLLSVSRIGTGQIIYCGLPLVEMISDLNLEAIHLLANILNY